MNTAEITKVLLSDIYARRVFCGVFPRDKLPRRIKSYRPCAFVINTDDSAGPGEHWVGVFYDGLGKCEYFDSFGVPPLHRDIESFLMRNSLFNYRYNYRMLQHATSSTCGLYVIYYILIKSRGGSLFRVLRPFYSYNTQTNDQIVIRLVRPFLKSANQKAVCCGI